MRKLCVFGDLHGKDVEVPEADAYLLTGDLSGLLDEADLKKTFRQAMTGSDKGRLKFLRSPHEQKNVKRFITSAYGFLKKLSDFGKPVYFVSGNREVIFKLLATQLNPHLKTLDDRIKNLKDVSCIDGRVVDVFGMRLLGIPFVPSGEWYISYYSKISGFKSRFEQLRMMPQRLMSVDADIVLSHCPPFGILDQASNFGNVGIKTIRNYLEKKNPKYLFCGHIHEAIGVKIFKKTIVVNMGASYYVFDL